MRAGEGGVRTVFEAGPVVLPPALNPLVSCLAGDPEEGAELGEVQFLVHG
jgi:hypothetical protein